MTAQPSNRISAHAPPKKQAQHQHTLSTERGHDSSSPFGLDAPTDLPTAILGLQTSSGNHAVEKLLHRSEHDATEASELSGPMSSILNSGRGRPLEPTVRTFMESRFGYDFGRVRIHDYPQAAESTRAIGALAYTMGRDIAFRDGQHTFESEAGRKLLAHELAHVVQ